MIIVKLIIKKIVNKLFNYKHNNMISMTNRKSNTQYFNFIRFQRLR